MLERLRKELLELELETEKAPGAFKCAITFEIMRNPIVVFPGGQTFEGSYLEQWIDSCLQQSRDITNPLTQQLIQNTDVNIAIKELIDERYGELFCKIDALRKRIRALEAEEAVAAVEAAAAAEAAEAEKAVTGAVDCCTKEFDYGIQSHLSVCRRLRESCDSGLRRQGEQQ